MNNHHWITLPTPVYGNQKKYSVALRTFQITPIFFEVRRRVLERKFYSTSWNLRLKTSFSMLIKLTEIFLENSKISNNLGIRSKLTHFRVWNGLAIQWFEFIRLVKNCQNLIPLDKGWRLMWLAFWYSKTFTKGWFREKNSKASNKLRFLTFDIKFQHDKNTIKITLLPFIEFNVIKNN